jgi:hypothetical protein
MKVTPGLQKEGGTRSTILLCGRTASPHGWSKRSLQAVGAGGAWYEPEYTVTEGT